MAFLQFLTIDNLEDLNNEFDEMYLGKTFEASNVLSIDHQIEVF